MRAACRMAPVSGMRGAGAQLPRQIVNAKDGSVLLLVPAGRFIMGGVGDEGEQEEHDPRYEIALSAFYIGKYAVTNAQFRKFVVAAHYNAAGPWRAYARRWGENAPVVQVSWRDATAYCHWAGLRLPTEAEWEKAARGTDGRSYPWGDAWDPSRCQCSCSGSRGAEGPSKVDCYPEGASPYGCLNMVGNVCEWCSSEYRPYPYSSTDGREASGGSEHRAVRGGAWDRWPQDLLLADLRLDEPPSYHSNNVGFRVARSP